MYGSPQNMHHNTQGSSPGIDPNKTYKILSATNPQYCLDNSANPASLYKLIIYRYHGGTNQHFRLRLDLYGYYYIVNCQTGGALQPPQDYGKAGGQCYIDQGVFNDNQTWRIMPSNCGFAIVMSDGQFCLDIQGESYKDDTPVVIWYTQNKGNQCWIFVEV